MSEKKEGNKTSNALALYRHHPILSQDNSSILDMRKQAERSDIPKDPTWSGADASPSALLMGSSGAAPGLVEPGRVAKQLAGHARVRGIRELLQGDCRAWALFAGGPESGGLETSEAKPPIQLPAVEGSPR